MTVQRHQIRLLGPPNFSIDQQPSGLLKSPKGVALVSYLIISGRPHARESLADLLGDTESTAQSLKNLRSLLNRIRRFVPEIAASRRTLAFVPGENTTIDLVQLRTGLAAESPLEAANAFQLYAGELLDGFHLRGAPRFNAWLAIERERLRREVLGISHRLSQQLFDQQAWQAGIDVAQQRLRLDNLDEEAHQWLMRCLASSGQIALARQQYARCRQLLWAELGVEPSTVTQQIARQIDQLAAATPAPTISSPQPLAWDGTTLPDPAPLPLGSIMPYRRNSDFVGRVEALHQLAQALIQAAAHPSGAVISGLGGIGKTQLAVEFAFRFGRFFPGGVYWMNFAAAANVPAEVATIGGARGLQLYQEGAQLSLAERVDRVRRAWQAPVRRLLIFDNCEDAHLLAEWLPVSGGCSVLATARKRSWPRELGMTSVPLTTLARAESVALLSKLTPQIKQRDGQAIAAELGDLPLALHLAGGFLHRYPRVTAQAYLAQLRDRDLLQHPSLRGHGSALSPTGHDLHIGKTFAVNYAQLTPRNDTDAIALRLLAAAACFAHGEPIAQSDLIRATVDQPDDWMNELLASDGIARLVELGFMDSNGDANVVLHRLVAVFVQAEDAAQHLRALDRVAAYLVDQLAATHRKTIYLGNLPVAAAHVRYVVEQGLQVGSLKAAQLSSWFALYRIDAGLFADTRRYVDEALAILRSHQPEAALALAHSLNVGGTLLFKQQLEVEAWPYYEEGYAICLRELGAGHIRTINMLQNLAILHWRTGRLEESLAMFNAALQHHEALQPPQEQLMIRVLQNSGGVLNTLGRYAEAQDRQERVLRIRLRTLPADHPQLGETYNSLGMIAYRRGAYEQAATYFRQCVEIRVQAFGADNLHVALPTANLGVALAYAGRPAQGLPHLLEATRIRRQSLTDESPLVARALALTGQVQLLAGAVATAETYLLQARATQTVRQPDHIATAESGVDLARVRLQQSRIAAADELLQRARPIYAATYGPDNPHIAPLLNTLGELALRRGDRERARVFFERAKSVLADKVLATHFEWRRATEQLATLESAA